MTMSVLQKIKDRPAWDLAADARVALNQVLCRLGHSLLAEYREAIEPDDR
jgi:hypothetical protein